MEFIIIAILTIVLATYSWYAGYKVGERKGWNDGQADMEKVYRQYFEYRPTGEDAPWKKENTQ